MHKTKLPTFEELEDDATLAEVRRIKEKLSAEYGHDIRKMFEAAREREKTSGRNVVSFADEPRKSPATED
jgi:hypothetical protein